MAEVYDFEAVWLKRLSDCLQEVADKETLDAVMVGSDALAYESGRESVIRWTRGAMERLEALVGATKGQRVMAGCACQYPTEDLEDASHAYAQTGDIDAALQTLRVQFESFLRDGLGLREEHVAQVVSSGWGLAGIRQGDRIVATKIPKSGYLADYLEETDREKRRQLYCHCPRVRDALGMGEGLPSIYCYCGAGFYQGIWKEILQRPVKVEVLESVLDGGEVCRIAISLPVEAMPEAQ